jgi:hypothetical protein
MKKSRDSGARDKTSNVSSGKSQQPIRPWTDKEMSSAKPLPLPTVEPTPTVPSSGSPHHGTGRTAPGGRPENDTEKSR